ncbi:hypothetical protein BH10PLA2_BH10PLA2_24230 [soil metagenome]
MSEIHDGLRPSRPVWLEWQASPAWEASVALAEQPRRERRQQELRLVQQEYQFLRVRVLPQKVELVVRILAADL